MINYRFLKANWIPFTLPIVALILLLSSFLAGVYSASEDIPISKEKLLPYINEYHDNLLDYTNNFISACTDTHNTTVVVRHLIDGIGRARGITFRCEFNESNEVMYISYSK